MKRIVWVTTLAAVCGCAHDRPDAGAIDAWRGTPLPDSVVELLAEADRAAVLGPRGPDLARSAAAATKVIEAEAAHAGAGWRLARALYYQTLVAGEDRAAALAERCMRAAEGAVEAEGGAQALVFSALCIAARVKVKHLEAPRLLPRLIERAKQAERSDPRAEHAAPSRILGAIYLRAPPWPVSVGDIDEALHHLERAAHFAPEWPENQLLLAEALLADDRPEQARRALDAARHAPSAPELAGWWALWSKDLTEIESKLGARRDR